MGFEKRKGGFLDERWETASAKEREDRLSQKLVEFVRYSYKHSRAFRERLDENGKSAADIRGLEDIEQLPLMRRDDLAARQKTEGPLGGFETVPPDRAGRIYVNPGFVFQPQLGDQDVRGWAEALFACGMRPGDIVQNTFNYHLWPFALTLDESLRTLGITVVPTGVGNTAIQVNIMRTLKASGFLGTPSFLMTLADRAEVMGLDLKKDLSLEVGFVSAEMLPEGLRQRLEEKWEMMVRQGYGTVFTGCLGYECYYKTGLHLPQDVIVEIVDPQSGKQIAPGTIGEIVATSFNSVFPLVRFATGDLSILVHEECPCGRTSYRLRKILGRVDQATKVKGTLIHPWQTDEIAARCPEVFKYQVVVAREDYTDTVTFVAEVRDESVDRSLLKRRLEKLIKEMLTVKGDVEVVPSGTIPDWHQKIVDRRRWD